ncbi:TLD domain-containing protein 2 [Taenia crassiceps]|uniref:Oxidation resistance protein 1 n=1 Tax=Taenia crassiceps TaxID=6207 RepID=A0ABR4QLI3_9CEST
MVESGNSTTAIAARFDPASFRLCRPNKLWSHNLITGQLLKVVKEEPERQKVKETIVEQTGDPCSSQGLANASNTVETLPSQEKRLRYVFKRLVGAEQLETSHTIRVNQAEKLKTGDSLAAGHLKIDARFCHNLHRCVRGTLIATIETIMFLPLCECEKTAAPCQAAIEMRYENVRSVAAYYDASVFVFTKRPRLPRQYTHGFPSEEIKCHILSTSTSSTNTIAPDEEKWPLEPVLLRNEVFLCCTVKRNRLGSGDSISPTSNTAGAQWFIVSKRSIEDLENFLINSNLGLASIIPMDSSSHKLVGQDNGRESLKTLSISDTIGSLISRRMTRRFRSAAPSITPSQSYISRSLSRLMQRTASAQIKIDSATATIGDSISGRRRHLSVGCSKELFSDHIAIDVIPDGKKAGDEAGSIIAYQTSSSTPSFADEKEVFDMLRQSSLAWELVSEQEFLQRCVLPEAEEERFGGCKATDSAIVTLLSPVSLLQSCILSSQTQIHELFEAIPTGAQFFDWSLTFSSELHGFSLKTLYRRCEDFVSGDLHADVGPDPCHTTSDAKNTGAVAKHGALSGVQRDQPCVLLIKDTTDCLMGAYLSCHPRLSRGVFYGTGETFVFHWTPSVTSPCEEEVLVEEITSLTSKSQDLCFRKYPWSKKNSFFVSGEPEVLLIGCSNASSALRIDENLNRGRSQICDTFDNPQLTPSSDFFIHTIELWSLR